MDCPICLQPFHEKARHTTRCSHTFHADCIAEWQARSHTCPMCREDTTTTTSRCCSIMCHRATRFREFPVRIQHIWYIVALVWCVILYPSTVYPEHCSPDIEENFTCTCIPLRYFWSALLVIHAICAISAIWSRVIQMNPTTHRPTVRVCAWLALWILTAAITLAIVFGNGPLVYRDKKAILSACGLIWMKTHTVTWLVISLAGIGPGVYIFILSALYVTDPDEDSAYITW